MGCIAGLDLGLSIEDIQGQLQALFQNRKRNPFPSGGQLIFSKPCRMRLNNRVLPLSKKWTIHLIPGTTIGKEHLSCTQRLITKHRLSKSLSFVKQP